MAKKKSRRRAEIPNDESKSDRFTRVVTPRVVKAVKAIEVIGFCAGSTYEYTPEQVKQIIEVLTASVGGLNAKFAGKAGGSDSFIFK